MTQIGKRRKVRATIHSAHWGFLAAEREGARERESKRGREGERERVWASVGQGKEKRSPRDN